MNQVLNMINLLILFSFNNKHVFSSSSDAYLIKHKSDEGVLDQSTQINTETLGLP